MFVGMTRLTWLLSNAARRMTPGVPNLGTPATPSPFARNTLPWARKSEPGWGIMRIIGWPRAATASCALGILAASSAMSIGSTPAYASTGCTTIAGSDGRLNTTSTGSLAPINLGSLSFDAGDTIYFGPITAGGATLLTLTGGPVSLDGTGAGQSYTFTTPTTATLTITLTVTATNSFVRFTCVGVGSSAAPTPTSAAVQSANNAKSGIMYGQQTLQNYNDWTTKAIVSSFGLGGGPRSTSARPTAPSATAKVERLMQEERDVADELDERRARRNPMMPAAADERIAGLERQLEAIRHSLAFARLGADIATRDPQRPVASLAPLSRDARPGEILARAAPGDDVSGAIGGDQRAKGAGPSLHLNMRELSDYCAESCETIDRKWNVWMEGRMFSAKDALAQTNALGFVGSTGGDYKVLPWLATGMSLGVESFRTNFGPGVGSTMTGFTAEPYFGFRLDDNMFASAFFGVSSLTYGVNPAYGVAGQFAALRGFFGGALTGVWHEGPWRLQPSVTGQYGTEQQYGYTDTAGNSVPPQVVTYGRISAGPEIGYTIKDIAGFVTIEPYVIGKVNIDFASSPVVLFNGTPLVVRSGTFGSGTAGLGFAMTLDNGIYFKIQGTYESIGVSGLDIWSGLVRAGVKF